MPSFTAPTTNLLVSTYSLPNLIPHACPSFFFVAHSRTRTSQQRFKLMNLASVTKCGCSLLGFSDWTKGYANYKGLLHCGCSGFVRRCKFGDREGEGDFALEAEILEFMKSSKKPGAFPSKKELVEAGRGDLVVAIVKKGGWLSLGWDLEEEERAQQSNFGHWDSVMAEEHESSVLGGDQIGAVVSSFSDDSSQAASSSGRSLEAATTEDDTGIEGILNRLEKQRNLALGFVLGDKEDSMFLANKDNRYDRSTKTSTDAVVSGLVRSSIPASLNSNKAIFNDSRGRPNHNEFLSEVGALRNSLKPEMWRTWSTKRDGFSDLDLGAAEFSYDKMGGSEDVSRDETLETREGANEPDGRNEMGANEPDGRNEMGANEPDGRNEMDSHHKGINHKQIRSRIQHLESELSSVLRSLRSKADEVASQKGHESSSEDSWKLSDAWEFQENEIMHAQDKLRSTRAKLAVLEGKMALTIIDVQKSVEEKQKRINHARRALRLLRTAFIVWPNSASEVFIAGSYDGWTAQRKMEKSSTGIFSLTLKLYPGRYEIKFIVDGEWRVDPLRPIVHNNGYENNVLIIT